MEGLLEVMKKNTVLDEKKKVAPGKFSSIYRALKTLGFENGAADFDTTNPDSKISQFIKDHPDQNLCLSGEYKGKTLAQIQEIKNDAEYLADDLNRFFKLGTEALTGVAKTQSLKPNPSNQK